MKRDATRFTAMLEVPASVFDPLKRDPQRRLEAALTVALKSIGGRLINVSPAPANFHKPHMRKAEQS